MNREIMMAIRPHPKDWKGEAFSTIEHKLDGVRCTIFRDTEITAIGKKERIDLWPRLSHNTELKHVVEMLPWDTIVDGEVTCDGNATEVTTALIEGSAEFTCFAIPLFDGMNWRNESSGGYRPVAEDAGLAVPKLHEIPVGVQVIPMLQHDAKELGIEGFVLKQYGWKNWYRVKPTKTIDLVVTGWKWGQSKYEGMLGSLEGSIWDGEQLVPVASVSGWTDRQRAELTWTLVKGRIMQVEFDKWESKGRLRFPRFDRWRPDKTAHQCVKEQ